MKALSETFAMSSIGAVLGIVSAALGLFPVAAGEGLTAQTRGAGNAAQPRADPGAPAAEETAIVRVKLGSFEYAPAIGPPDAPVTVVAFIDYECPYCARAHRTIEEVIEKYGEKVRVVFKHNPLSFHPDAELAAEAVLAANDLGKFPEMHRKLLENQKELKRENLVDYAAAVGLERVDVEAALDAGAFRDDVKADIALAEKIGVNATPYFFVNGREVRGAKPFETFAKIIDEELTGPPTPTRWVERIEPRRRRQPARPSPGSGGDVEDLLPAGSVDAVILRHLAEVHRELRQLRSDVKQLRMSVAELARQSEKGRGAIRASGVVPAVSLDDDPVRGNREARVGILAFSDYQCPYSRKAALRVLPSLKKAYIDTGKVQYILRDYPLQYHTQAKAAAVAANCAGKQNAYWKMHDALYVREGTLGPRVYEQIASQLELDMAAFRACMRDPAQLEEVEQDVAYADANDIGLRVTPTFYIGRVEKGQLVNAYKLSGVKTYEDFSRIIETLLK